MNGNNERKSFRFCEKCNKKLIERLPNGMWRFQFGKKFSKDGEEVEDYIPVELFIHGSLKIKCLKRGCSHWNVFHYFPSFPFQQSPERRAKDNQQLAEYRNHANKSGYKSKEKGGDGEWQEQVQ